MRREDDHTFAYLMQLIDTLSHSYTPAGIAEWLGRPRRQLDGRTPTDCIRAGEWERVLELAESSRDQVAA